MALKLAYNQINIYLRIHLLQMQSDRSSVADAVNSWIRIKQEIPETYKKLKYFQKQYQQGVTDFSIAAHMLHPLYTGIILQILINEL